MHHPCQPLQAASHTLQPVWVGPASRRAASSPFWPLFAAFSASQPCAQCPQQCCLCNGGGGAAKGPLLPPPQPREEGTQAPNANSLCFPPFFGPFSVSALLFHWIFGVFAQCTDTAQEFDTFSCARHCGTTVSLCVCVSVSVCVSPPTVTHLVALHSHTLFHTHIHTCNSCVFAVMLMLMFMTMMFVLVYDVSLPPCLPFCFFLPLLLTDTRVHVLEHRRLGR